jgi:hypothetical protein
MLLRVGSPAIEIELSRSFPQSLLTNVRTIYIRPLHPLAKLHPISLSVYRSTLCNVDANKLLK